MTLDEYLGMTGESMTAFAARAGLHTPTAWRIAKQARIPTPEIMWRIFVATGRLVGPEDYYGFRQRLRDERRAQREAETKTEEPQYCTEAA